MSQISRTFNGGDSCTISATPSSHYHFVNWTENGSELTRLNPYTFTVNSNRTITGNFAIDTHTVSASVSPNAGGTVSGGGSYNYGASCTLTYTPATGYTFDHWEDGIGQTLSSSNPYTFTVERDTTVVAICTANNYTVSTSVDPVSSGTVSGGGSYSYGSSCTLTATPASGYNFSSWSVGGAEVSTGNPYTFTVNSNVSVVANFALGSHTITTTNSPVGGGTITGAGSYNYGQTCTLVATPNNGYHFVRWTNSGGTQVSTNATYSFTVSGDASYIAVYELNEYSIIVNRSPDIGGSVSGAGTYTHGSSVSLTATAASGYAFVGWFDSTGTSRVSTANPLTFTATQDITYVAVFAPVYTVEVNYNNSQGSVSFVEVEE